MTTLVMVSLFILGIAAYNILPVSDLPSIEYPTIEVTTSYPGASPDTMADTVTSPLERAFTTIDGIQMIASSSSVGESIIVLQFVLSKSIDAAAQDVQAAINQATPNLPPDLPNFPTYQKTNPTQSPVTFISVASKTMPLGEIYEYAYSLIGQRLSMINGVSDVIVYGEPKAVRIQVDPDYLAAHQIGINEVANVIVNSNPQEPTGNLYGPNHEYIIDIDGQLKQASEYDELILRNNNHALLKVKTLGKAINSVQDDKYSLSYITRDKKLPCVVIGIIKQSHANTIKVIQGVNQIIDQMKPSIPQSVELKTLFDQSTWIEQSVNDVEFTLLVAIILVVIVVLFYLGKVIDTLIPLIALPLSILGTFIAMSFYGFNIDILSLLAITLSVGFLVDDAIVVLENINRHLEMGKTRWQATLNGSKEISMTVVAMTLCLTAIFIPMVFMPGVMGRLFREFSITIITAVTISGLVSLTLTPMLCSQFLAPAADQKRNWIECISDKINHFLLSHYQRALDWVFQHPFSALTAGLASVGITLFLLLILPTTFLPGDDLGFIQGFGLASDSTSPDKMNTYQNTLSEIIKNNPNVDNLVAVSSKPTSNQSLMFIRLNPIDQRAPIKAVIDELLEEMSHVPGVKTFLRPMPLINLDVGTQTSMGDYQYTLQGLNREALYRDSDKVLTEMKKSPYFRQVASDLHDKAAYVHLTIDRDRSYDLNVSADAIERTFEYAYSSGRLSLINGQTDQYYVIIETIPTAYSDPSVLEKLYVSAATKTPIPTDNPTHTGPAFPTQVPLSEIADWEIINGPLKITHINTLPAVTISYDLSPGIPLSQALKTLKEISAKKLSPGITALSVGSAQAFESSLKNLAILSLLTLIAIYVILGILYENFIHPITVMSALPPAALGALITLVAFGETISLYSLIGMMMLLGIVLKNGIMLIDFANTGIEDGKDLKTAIREACHQRLRPILMTTFAAMMGALPIALGVGGLTAESRRPLGMVIVGGLIISQVLTLFFTPTIFILLEELREKWSRKKQTPPQET